MRNLFGEGRHPDAERLEDAALDAGASVAAAKKASQLGRVFAVYTGNAPEFAAGDRAPVRRLQLRAREPLGDPGPGAGAGPDPYRARRLRCSPPSTAGPRSMTANAPATWRGRPGSRPRR